MKTLTHLQKIVRLAQEQVKGNENAFNDVFRDEEGDTEDSSSHPVEGPKEYE